MELIIACVVMAILMLIIIRRIVSTHLVDKMVKLTPADVQRFAINPPDPKTQEEFLAAAECELEEEIIEDQWN